MNHIEGMIKLTREIKSLENHFITDAVSVILLPAATWHIFAQFKLKETHRTLSEKKVLFSGI